MKYTQKVLILFTALTLSAMPVFANRGQKNSPCKADIERLCGDKKGNRTAMKACIKANKENFSAECKAKKDEYKAKHSERKEKMAKAMQTCDADIQKLCPEAKADGAKKHVAMKCLKQNRDKLSAECKATLPAKRVHKEK